MSNTATLSAETGRITGSSSSRRLRTEDRIPGILYGQGMQPLVLSVTRRDLRVALSGPAGYNTILNLTVGGQSFNAVVLVGYAEGTSTADAFSTTGVTGLVGTA